MSRTVIIVGRAGSGKSTAARELQFFAQQHGLSVVRHDDFWFFRELFLADKEHVQFTTVEDGSFACTDQTIPDKLLRRLEFEAQLSTFSGNEVVIVEFARTNYAQAFRQFSTQFMRRLNFIFLDAKIETCLGRVHARTENPQTADDHTSFPDDIFRQQYAYDNYPYMSEGFQKAFPGVWHAIITNEEKTKEEFCADVCTLAKELFVQNRLVART